MKNVPKDSTCSNMGMLFWKGLLNQKVWLCRYLMVGYFTDVCTFSQEWKRMCLKIGHASFTATCMMWNRTVSKVFVRGVGITITPYEIERFSQIPCPANPHYPFSNTENIARFLNDVGTTSCGDLSEWGGDLLYQKELMGDYV